MKSMEIQSRIIYWGGQLFQTIPARACMTMTDIGVAQKRMEISILIE